MSLKVAVCITTHNRRAELARTLGEIARLNPAPDEILVVADGCTDGTDAFVRNDYPLVKLRVHSTARGSIPSRNELAQACTSDVLLSLDDDSYPLDNESIALVRAMFAANDRLAVASFPQRTDEHPGTLQVESFGPAHFVGSYANSAAAIRVSVFKELGGYPEFFFHAYEEPDFALRCLAAGWEVKYEPAVTVRHHFTATERNEIRTHHRHSRNELWSVLMRCPAPQVFAVALFRVVRQFGYAWRRGPQWVVREPQWWLSCLAGLPRCLAARAPLAWDRYLGWMKLLRSPIHDRAEWLSQFSPSR
jgi:GT2 family glycosyltransferase